ncbi:MAG: hypothetical protein WC451_00895 [Patescibacteria group bacterium]|jgi:hypothetical protein
MPNKEEKNEIDFKKLSTNYFEAAIENSKIANEIIKNFQNWLLIFSIAELTFIGSIFSIDFDKTQKILFAPVISLISVAGYLLLSNFIFFFIACKYQHTHVLKSTRFYFKLSEDVKDFNKKVKQEVEDLPDCLSDKDLAKFSTDNKANLFFNLSVLAIFLATLIIIIIFPLLFNKAS